jgi:hypothetical protein
MRLRLAGKLIERKSRLSHAWRQLSPPAAISVQTVSEFASPGSFLPQLRGDYGCLIGMIASGRA